MKKTIFTIYSLVVVWLISCTPTSEMTEGQKKWSPKWRIQAGINHGGIVENTDFTKNQSIPIDGFSGATKIGANAGVHVLLPVFSNSIESGLDFMYNNQTFSYADAINNYSGTRKLSVSQFMIPVTYSHGFFKKSFPGGLFQLKIGYLCQINLINISNSGSNLPKYSTNNFSNGFTMGFSSTPINLSNGSSLGVYMDMYRGSKVFDDFYNSKTFEMPATSFFKAGIIYQFGK